MFINSGEKLPILYNGDSSLPWIDALFCKLHHIGPSNMCINFENNRLTIDDFRS